MRRALPLLIVLCLGFAPAPVYRVKPVTSKDELRALQGEWETISYSLDGGPLSVCREEYTTVFRGNRQSRVHKGEVNARWDMVLDPSKDPKLMDMKDADVPARTLLGIYRIDGDTLTIVYRNKVNAPERPRDFRPHPLMYVEVFRRKRP